MSRARYTTLAYTPGLSSLDRTRVAADVSADIQELRQRLRSEISTQSELKHEIKDLQRELANRVDDLSAKDRELSQQHIALQKLKQQYTKIQVDYEHLEREKENLAAENKWLKSEISAAAETHRSLENERLELRAKIVSTEGMRIICSNFECFTHLMNVGPRNERRRGFGRLCSYRTVFAAPVFSWPKLDIFPGQIDSYSHKKPCLTRIHSFFIRCSCRYETQRRVRAHAAAVGNRAASE